MSHFLDALHFRNQQRPPIWLMRQAGRYLPSYLKLRECYTLLELFHTPELIVEVTKLPFKEIPFDAAIIFADLLSLLDTFSYPWDFEEGKGPIIPPLTLDFDLHPRPAKQTYGYLEKAIRQLKTELAKPLIGFAGAPFTVASYLIEGKSSRDLLSVKKWMYAHPQNLHALLKKLTAAAIDYLHLQIECGVDAVQLFDSWANVLSVSDFRTFCLPYLKEIVDSIKPKVPVVVFCRGSCLFAKELSSIAPTAISLDWQREMGEMRRLIPQTIALQGNLDPALLFAPKEKIRYEAKRILDAMHGEKSFIFNLGHGIFPKTPLDHVKELVDYVHSYTGSSSKTD